MHLLLLWALLAADFEWRVTERPAFEWSITEAAEEQYVHRINVADRQASCVYLGDGTFVTAGHVLRSIPGGTPILIDGQQYGGTWQVCSLGDAAVLHLRGVPDWPAVETSDLASGDQVVIVGQKTGRHVGTVADTTYRNGEQAVEIDAPTRPGDSGGGVFVGGRLAGIHSGIQVGTTREISAGHNTQVVDRYSLSARAICTPLSMVLSDINRLKGGDRPEVLLVEPESKAHDAPFSKTSSGSGVELRGPAPPESLRSAIRAYRASGGVEFFVRGKSDYAHLIEDHGWSAGQLRGLTLSELKYLHGATHTGKISPSQFVAANRNAAPFSPAGDPHTRPGADIPITITSPASFHCPACETLKTYDWSGFDVTWERRDGERQYPTISWRGGNGAIQVLRRAYRPDQVKWSYERTR